MMCIKALPSYWQKSSMGPMIIILSTEGHPELIQEKAGAPDTEEPVSPHTGVIYYFFRLVEELEIV